MYRGSALPPPDFPDPVLRRDALGETARAVAFPIPDTAAPRLRFVKQSSRDGARISLILLDWSVRESFHLLHYLALQDVSRDLFDVIVVEYYSRESAAVSAYQEQVDTWVLLGMPDDCYYHKHLMYNAGILLAKGEICVVCDSDAMVKPGFIRAILSAFDEDPSIVLHLDQFRNTRRDLYPFAFPSFDEVTGRGCINNAGGRTTGLAHERDPIHDRNYGACMCARRADLIAIGGADEHRDYLGHVCGPYDMTFRLVNMGRREVWHAQEFLYHTWHPGQAGADNYLGPHDGRHVSTTALDALASGRVLPLTENRSIRTLRERGPQAGGDPEFDIRPDYRVDWRRSALRRGDRWIRGRPEREHWRGFVVEASGGGLAAHPRVFEHPLLRKRRAAVEVQGRTEDEVRRQIEGRIPFVLKAVLPAIGALTFVSRALGLGYMFARRRLGRKLRR